MRLLTTSDMLENFRLSQKRRLAPRIDFRLWWRKATFIAFVWHAQCAISLLYSPKLRYSIPKLVYFHPLHCTEYMTRNFCKELRRGNEGRRLLPVSSQQTATVEVNQSSLKSSYIVYDEESVLCKMRDYKRNAAGLLREGRLPEVLELIERMLCLCRRMRFLDINHNESSLLNQKMSELVDEAFQEFAMVAFVPVARRSKPHQQRLKFGMTALQLQLASSAALVTPYDTVPKAILLMALRALTTSMETHGNELITCTSSSRDVETDSCTVMDTSDAAFRILQRLIVGAGVRPNFQKGGKRLMAEKDFHRVLIAFSKVGKVDEAQRMVKLQERHAGDFSAENPAVAYSILLKGYGRLQELENVEKTLTNFCHQLETRQDVEPDIILLNSLIDAFINCGALAKAQTVFEYMRWWSVIPKGLPEHANRTALQSISDATMDSLAESSLLGFLRNGTCPPPNKRTYNTMLKGFAKNGTIDKAISLANEMEQLNLWDDVTTNTLVHAAVQSGDLEWAETILINYTTSMKTSQVNENLDKESDSKTSISYSKQDQNSATRRSNNFQHPNVEAYTELLDAYGKTDQLEKAMSIMQTMRERGVEPNEVTYTCVVGALARHRKIDQAHRVLAYMESSACNVRLTATTYNAFISGLVSCGPRQTEGEDFGLDGNVDEALLLLHHMTERGINPNAITVSVLIESFGRCQQPRVEEAKTLMRKLEQSGIVSRTNPKIATSLIRTCCLGGDLKGAAEAFRGIPQPDVAALNAFLDACCRCNMLSMALQTFQHFFQLKTAKLRQLVPDVITYSVLIGAFLNSKSLAGAHRAQQMYNEMKSLHFIRPDKRLIDM